MSSAKIVQEKIEENNKRFSAVYLETKNAGLILLSEGEDQLGTLAVAIPQPQKMVGPPLSSILLGDRNVITARLFAERLAQKMNKIGLASIFIKSISEREAGPILVKLFEKTMKKEEKQKNGPTKLSGGKRRRGTKSSHKRPSLTSLRNLINSALVFL